MGFISGVSLTTRSRMTAEVRCQGSGDDCALPEVEDVEVAFDLSVAGEVEAHLVEVKTMV